MTYIGLGIMLLIMVGLASKIREYIVGQIFLFTIIVTIVLNIFSGIIPFSEILIGLSTCVTVGCILYAAYMWIFRGGLD